MIPILYDSTETSFTSNGIGRLRDCISCTVTEERNGGYELEMEYPINGAHFADLAPGMIIGVIHDDDHDIQPFEIYSQTANLETVTYYAHHVSYRLTDILVSPFTASGVSNALSGIASHSVNTNPFTFSTDKTTAGDYAVERPKSARSALLGEEGSALDIFGGEYEFDKWTVTLHASRGSDTGVTVRYGKNMLGVEQEIGGDLYNAVAPYMMDGETYVYLPEYYVQPTTPPVQPLKIRAVDFSEYFTEAPTEAQLRTFAQNWINAEKPWIPKENIKVDFIALWQTEEFKDKAEIQRVSLCDTVSIYYTQLGIVAEKQKVVKTVYDVLKERLTEIEVGDLSNQYVAVTGGTQSSGEGSDRMAYNIQAESGYSFTNISCNRSGGVVCIDFVTGSASWTSSYVTVATLPEAIRPAAQVSGMGARGTVVGTVAVNSDGTMQIRTFSNVTGAFRGSVTYII